jgi:hypothetical protein
MLWPAKGGWEGRLKRIDSGKESHIENLDALLTLLTDEERSLK